jgi:hypothetical protein
MVTPLSVRKMVQPHAQNRPHGSTVVNSPQSRCDRSEAANADGLTPCRPTSSRRAARAADRRDRWPSRASFTDWSRLCRIRSASFPTGVKDVVASFVLEDCHIGEGFFMAIVIAHHELDSDLHGGYPPVWLTPAGWLILLQTEELPPRFLMLSPLGACAEGDS